MINIIIVVAKNPDHAITRNLRCIYLQLHILSREIVQYVLASAESH